MSAVRVDRLTKTFTQRRRANARGIARLVAKPVVEEVHAVQAISFDVAKGERVAFIGPNGAGKSTTLKMLCGILNPTSGEAEILGHTPWTETKALAYEIGIVFGQRSQLWAHLPVTSSFELLAKIYDVSEEDYRRRLAHLIETFAIGHLIDRPVRTLSLGQRMRCEIAASLIHGPKVLFLDEPTIGLDVAAKAQLRDHLKRLSEEDDLTLLLTSHDTGDIEEICERVILINHGQKLIDQPLDDLKRHYMTHKLITLATEEEAPDFSSAGVELIESGKHQLILSVDLAATKVDDVVREALSSLAVRDLMIENAPLESIIMQIYGEAA
jgi:ABC-2 type transport system ATP-binding protein